MFPKCFYYNYELLTTESKPHVQETGQKNHTTGMYS